MTRRFTDLQMLRNLLPDIPDSNAEQALLNVLSWMYENAVGDTSDGLYDAIASAYSTEFEFGGEA